MRTLLAGLLLLLLAGSASASGSVIDSTFEPAQETALGRRFIADTGARGNGSSAETAAVLVVNLSTNTASLYLDELELTPRITANSTPNSVVYKCYTAPVVTSSGTALGIDNSNSTFSTTKSKMQVFVGPTISSNGTVIHTKVVHGSNYRSVPQGRFVLAPGAKMLITSETGLIAAQYAIFMSWWEK
jgi:hypothetical protein